MQIERTQYDLDLDRLGEVTPLICAILFRHFDIARLLLREGCSTEVRDPAFGYTPLHFAIIVNSLNFVMLLKEYNLLFKVLDRNKKNIVYFALDCHSCHSVMEIVQY